MNLKRNLNHCPNHKYTHNLNHNLRYQPITTSEDGDLILNISSFPLPLTY